MNPSILWLSFWQWCQAIHCSKEYQALASFSLRCLQHCQSLAYMQPYPSSSQAFIKCRLHLEEEICRLQPCLLVTKLWSHALCPPCIPVHQSRLSHHLVMKLCSHEWLCSPYLPVDQSRLAWHPGLPWLANWQRINPPSVLVPWYSFLIISSYLSYHCTI